MVALAAPGVVPGGGTATGNKDQLYAQAKELAGFTWRQVMENTREDIEKALLCTVERCERSGGRNVGGRIEFIHVFVHPHLNHASSLVWQNLASDHHQDSSLLQNLPLSPSSSRFRIQDGTIQFGQTYKHSQSDPHSNGRTEAVILTAPQDEQVLPPSLIPAPHLGQDVCILMERVCDIYDSAM